jgi:hypothetical protein
LPFPFVKGPLLSGLDSQSTEVLRPDRGDADCGLKSWTILDDPGDERTSGLSISLELEAETPVSRLPLSESRMDLVRLGPGKGSDDAADVTVGVGGRDIV